MQYTEHMQEIDTEPTAIPQANFQGDVVIPRAAVGPRVVFVSVVTLVFGFVFLGLGFASGFWYKTNQVEKETFDYIAAVPSIDNVTPVAPEKELPAPKLVVASTDIFVSNELGFILSLPAEFKPMKMTEVPAERPGVRLVTFDLPVKGLEFESQQIFSIIRYADGEELVMGGPQGTLLAAQNGYRYYYYPSLDMGIPESAPEYASYMDMAQYDLLQVVQDGFKVQ